MTITGNWPSSEITENPTASLLSLFPTPVAKIPCPFAAEINSYLGDAILGRSDTEKKGLAYKTETVGDLTGWGDPRVDQLTSWVLRMARTFVETVRRQPLHDAVDASSPADVRLGATRCWASIYRGGDHHPPHNHPNTAIAAVYYVSAPGPCELEFTDPRVNVDLYDPGITFANEGQGVRVKSSPGVLLLLPGWMKHSVPTYDGHQPRISIAWNLSYAFSGNAGLRPAGD